MTHAIQNYYERQFSDNLPTSIVVLCHGLGSNGQDLISLAPMWAKELPDTLFISPDAPFPCDMVPPGWPNAFQWFSLQSRDPHKVLEGVETAAPILTAFLDGLLGQYKLPASKLALVGFSQGTMMSLYAGPRRARRIAGVVGYAGALVGAEGLKDASVQKIPVALVHGDSDTVVPVQAYYRAKEELTAAGFAVEGHVRPGLDHGIDEDGIEIGAKFLSRIFS